MLLLGAWPEVVCAEAGKAFSRVSQGEVLLLMVLVAVVVPALVGLFVYAAARSISPGPGSLLGTFAGSLAGWWLFLWLLQHDTPYHELSAASLGGLVLSAATATLGFHARRFRR